MNKKRLEHVLNKFNNKKVLVIGDICLDKYTIGTVDRLSPEAPVPLLNVQEEKFKLGMAANVAENIQALGASSYLLSMAGHDKAKEELIDLLNKSDINHRILSSNNSTIIKERIISEGQQLLRIDYEEIQNQHTAELLNDASSILHEMDIILVEDYGKGLFSKGLLQSIITKARLNNKKVVVDPNTRNPIDFYIGAWILTPNKKEAEHLSKIKIVNNITLNRAGEKILKMTQAQYVIITLGKDGMAIFTKDKKVKKIPTFAKEVYDVSGAGDTAIAVLTLAMVSGASIVEATLLANIAAGIEVGKRGTAIVTKNEIFKQLSNF